MAITTAAKFKSIWTELDALYGALALAPQENTINTEPAQFGDYGDTTNFTTSLNFANTVAEFPEYSNIVAAMTGAGAPVGIAALFANAAFVKMANQYVAFLENGNPAIDDIAKDRGGAPNPGQSFHDNILGNITNTAIKDRFTDHAADNFSARNDGVDEVVAEPRSGAAQALGERALFSGFNNAGDLARQVQSLATDLARGFDRADFSPLAGKAAVVDQMTGAATVFTSIQAAVNAAIPYQVVVVGPGTFNESVTINKPLDLVGAGAGETFVTSPSGSAFTIDSDLDGEIIGVRGFSFKSSPVAGILFTNAAKLQGLYISDSAFEANDFYGLAIGGGMTAVNLGYVEVRNTTFTGNGKPQSSSGDGDLLFFQYFGDARLENLTITGQNRGFGPGENGIQFRGDGGPIGDVQIKNVTIGGVYEKQPLAVFNYTSLAALDLDNVTITADSTVFNVAANFDGIGGNFALSGLNATGAPDPVAIQGDGGVNKLTGGAEKNTLNGKNGADELNGGGGDDTLIGGGGNDKLNGGPGTDTAVYAGPRADYLVEFLLDAQGRTIGFKRVKDNNASNGDEGDDTLTSIERLQFSDTVLTLSPTPVTVSARVSVDGEQIGTGAVVTRHDARNNDLEIGGGKATGLLFQNVQIPDDVTITGAFIELTSQRNQSGASTIKIELLNDATLSGMSGTGVLTQPGFTEFGAVDWAVSSTWASGQKVTTPNLKSLVQQLVADQPQGDDKYDFLFSLEGTGATRRARPEEFGDAVAAKLVITYEAGATPPPPAPETVTVKQLVTLDAEQRGIQALKILQDQVNNDLEVGVSDQSLFIFRDVDLKAGSKITDAYLTLTSQRAQSGSSNMRIELFNDPDGPSLTGTNVLGNPGFDAFGFKNWSVSNNWTAGQKVQTPNLKDLVQLLVNQNPQADGDFDLAFGFSGTGATRRFSPEEFGDNVAAELTIVYETLV